MPAKLQVLCYSVGVIVGIIYVFQEYRSRITSDKIDQYPRLKNLVYLVGTSTIGFIIDWKGLAKVTGQNVEIDRFELWLYYACATALTILVLLLITTGWVAFDAIRRNRRVPERARIAPLTAVGLYLRRGYFAYEEKIEEVQNRLAQEVDAKSAVLHVCQAISTAIAAVESYRQSGANREYFASGILDLIVTTTITQLPELRDYHVTANYMRAIPRSDATQEQLDLVQFESPPFHDCSHILLLERNVRGNPSSKLALPVHKDDKKLLPGNPVAFSKNKVVAVITARPTFQKGVPKSVKSQIISHFETVDFKSFLCVPMQRGDNIVGVVNIEVDSEIFNMKDSRIADVGQSLHPLCMSLSYLSE